MAILLFSFTFPPPCFGSFSHALRVRRAMAGTQGHAHGHALRVRKRAGGPFDRWFDREEELDRVLQQLLREVQEEEEEDLERKRDKPYHYLDLDLDPYYSKRAVVSRAHLLRTI